MQARAEILQISMKTKRNLTHIAFEALTGRDSVDVDGHSGGSTIHVVVEGEL